MNYLFEITPVAKPRMTRADKWKKRKIVLDYYAYKQHLVLLAKIQRFTLPEIFKVFFVIEMPNSWSEKKKTEMNGSPHKSTPDLDNLFKGFTDALTDQDKEIHDIYMSKKWGYKSHILIDTID